MRLIVGLGNVGKEYEKTKHNFGFMVVNEIVKSFDFSGPIKKFKSELYQGKIEKEKVIIIKPQTYMNKSGIAVSQVKKFYKIPIKNIIVFHDDMDLELGKIKIKIGGGDAGHNGIKNISELIGKNFMRIRLGVGRPKTQEDTKSYVVSKFKKGDKKVVEIVVKKVSELLHYLFTDHILFLNKFYL